MPGNMYVSRNSQAYTRSLKENDDGLSVCVYINICCQIVFLVMEASIMNNTYMFGCVLGEVMTSGHPHMYKTCLRNMFWWRKNTIYIYIYVFTYNYN